MRTPKDSFYTNHGYRYASAPLHYCLATSVQMASLPVLHQPSRSPSLRAHLLSHLWGSPLPRGRVPRLCVSIPGASTERRVACSFLVLVPSRVCPELYVVSAALLVCSARPVEPGPSLALLPQRCPCRCPRPSSSAPFSKRSVMVRVSSGAVIVTPKLSFMLCRGIPHRIRRVPAGAVHQAQGGA